MKTVDFFVLVNALIRLIQLMFTGQTDARLYAMFSTNTTIMQKCR